MSGSYYPYPTTIVEADGSRTPAVVIPASMYAAMRDALQRIATLGRSHKTRGIAESALRLEESTDGT